MLEADSFNVFAQKVANAKSVMLSQHSPGWTLSGYKAFSSPPAQTPVFIECIFGVTAKQQERESRDWDQEHSGMVMANHTACKYSSLFDHETITFYRIKTGILISFILWLKVASQICGQDIFVPVTSKSLYLQVNSVYIMLFDFRTVQNQRHHGILNHGVQFYSSPGRICKHIKICI